MPTPRAGYFLDGVRIPGTTTIGGRFQDSGALKQWFFRQGYEQGLAGDPNPSPWKESEKAANIGTAAHRMVELKINKREAEIASYVKETLPDARLQEKAWSAYQAFLNWERNCNITFIDTEIQLISKEYRYGGTIDAIGILEGKYCLVDFKTSKDIYAEYLVQLAAYGNLWNENHPDRKLGGGYHLLRFSKENADFAHHYYSELDIGWEQFKLFRQAYENDKELKRRAG